MWFKALGRERAAICWLSSECWELCIPHFCTTTTPKNDTLSICWRTCGRVVSFCISSSFLSLVCKVTLCNITRNMSVARLQPWTQHVRKVFPTLLMYAETQQSSDTRKICYWLFVIFSKVEMTAFLPSEFFFFPLAHLKFYGTDFFLSGPRILYCTYHKTNRNGYTFVLCHDIPQI